MDEPMVIPRDGYEAYYHRKLWDMLPGLYRQEDGDHGTLDRLLELVAIHAAQLRRSQDRMWENQSVEVADSWVLPYLADLVATRTLSELNPRGRRVDIAKTIYYRRRAGTPGVLEELVGDIAGWRGRLVEGYRTLVRMPHRLDAPVSAPPASQLSRTPPGGLADLRNAHAALRVQGPFDEYHYLPDFRPHTSVTGRHNIPVAAFHLYRLEVFRIDGATPARVEIDGDADADHFFTFDPSGRDTPLYSPGELAGGDFGDVSGPASVPMQLDCEELNHAAYRITDEVIDGISQHFAASDVSKPPFLEQALAQFREADVTFQSRGEFHRLLLHYTQGADANDSAFKEALSALDQLALVPGCGRAFLESGEFVRLEADGDTVALHRVAAASLDDAERFPSHEDIDAFIDPQFGRISADETPEAASYHYAVPGRVGAGPWYRPEAEMQAPLTPWDSDALTALPSSGVVHIEDNRTYETGGPVSVEGTLVIQAANGCRPLVDVGQEWRITGEESSDEDDVPNRLVLDGLWLAARAEDDPEVVIDGHFEQVVIRHCTFDPGGDGGSRSELATSLAPLRLEVAAAVGQLVVHSSVLGAVEVTHAQHVGEVRVTESAVVAPSYDMQAMTVAPGASVEMEGVTVVGETDVPRLDASNVIFAGAVDVDDHQTGCVRFSAAPSDAGLPRPYRVHRFVGEPAIFVSRQYGHPCFLRLRDHCDVELRLGAERQMEMGVYHSHFEPARRADLRAKIDEYLPFGQIPIFINET